MSFIYNHAKHVIDFTTLAAQDLRVLLVMANTTADTEDDVTSLAGFTALDEMDGANYVRKALANESWAKDAANDRSELDADDVTWTALGAGTRNVVGMVLYKHVTNDADSIPIAFIDQGGFPFTASGADVTIQWNAEGILHQS